MFYSIYRNGTMIGEKRVELSESTDGFDVFIEVNVGTSKRKIEASFDNNNIIASFNVFNNVKTLVYDRNENMCIHSNQRFIIDEILMVCFERLKGVENEYIVFSTESFDFYKMKFQQKEQGKYNILVPTHAYLEYDREGFLEYLEDFKDGLQIIREV